MTDQELQELAQEIEKELPVGYQTLVVGTSFEPRVAGSVGIHSVGANGHPTGCLTVFCSREDWNKFQDFLNLWSQKSLEPIAEIVNAEVFRDE